MMGKGSYIVAACFLGFNGFGSASNGLPPDSLALRHTDSLLGLIRQAPTDAQRFERYLDLSLYWSELDTARAFSYLAEARKLAGKRPTDFQRGLLHQFHANIVFGHRMDEAKAEYAVADRLLSSDSSAASYRYRSKLWNNYGVLLQIGDSADRYMDVIVNRVIPYAKAGRDSIAVGNGLLNIGLILANAQDFEKADQYYREAIRVFSTAKGAEEHQLTVNVQAARAAIFARRHPHARKYLDSAAAVFSRIPHSLYAAHYYRTEGQYYRSLKQQANALAMFDKAIGHADELNNPQVVRDIHFERYATYRDAGDFRQAKASLTVANGFDAWAGLEDKMLHIHEMAKTEHRLGNFEEAYRQLEGYLVLNDSLQQRDAARNILGLEKKYRTLEKEKEILQLATANQRQQLAMDRVVLWLILAVAAFVIAVITAVFWRKLARSNKRALFQNEKLHRQELQAIKQKERVNQYRTVIEVQEEERNRIARDLHDGLGGLLAGMKLRLSTIAGKVHVADGTLEPGIKKVISELDHAANDLRRIARNMMPEALVHMGLRPALTDLCSYLDTKTTAVKFQGLDMREKYPHELLIGVYRIAQELLNNAIKHAEASRIIVQCSDEDGCLSLTVEDNGIGFLVERDRYTGLGLKSVENRVGLLMGKLEIDAETGRGTTVNIEIPIADGATD